MTKKIDYYPNIRLIKYKNRKEDLKNSCLFILLGVSCVLFSADQKNQTALLKKLCELARKRKVESMKKVIREIHQDNRLNFLSEAAFCVKFGGSTEWFDCLCIGEMHSDSSTTLCVLANEGADLNKQSSKNGDTIVHLAIRSLYSEAWYSEALFKRLIELGADISIQNHDKQTPLELANKIHLDLKSNEPSLPSTCLALLCGLTYYRLNHLIWTSRDEGIKKVITRLENEKKGRRKTRRIKTIRKRKN